MHRVLREINQRGLLTEEMSEAVQSCPIFLGDAVSRLAIINDGKVKGAMDESVRVS